MSFNDILKNLSSYCGLDSQETNLYDNGSKIKENLDQDIKGFKNLSEYLSYKYFDEEYKLFIGDKGNTGFLLQISPLIGINDSSIKNLEHFFNNEMPRDSWIQFLLIASSDITPSIEYWKSGRIIQDDIITKLADFREEFLYKKASSFKESNGIIARDFKLYLSFNTKISDDAIELKKLGIFMQNLKQKLDAINLNPIICDPKDLIDLVKELLELELNSTIKKENIYNPNIILSEQILSPLFKHKILDDRIEHISSKLTSKAYFPIEMPKEFSLQNAVRLLGDGARDYLTIPARFVLSYIIANDINTASQNALIQKGDRVIDSSEQWYSRNNRDVKREANEWRDINDRAKNGENFLKEYFQIIMTAPKDFIDEAEQILFSLYQILDWRLGINKYFQLPALLSILPMQSYIIWEYLQYFKLTKIALSKEIIAKLPIHGEWKGVPMPGMLLLGRRGQIFHWNPFYRVSSGNYNICVFGPSGSGKSVFLQDLATNMIAQNTRIFILDIGKSFKNIATLLSGEIIEFGQNSQIILNPFYGFKNEMNLEDRNIAISYAKSIICSMCGAKGDHLKESIIEKYVIKGLEIHGSSFDITKLSEMLSSDANEISLQLSMSLFSYSRDGLYGKFFGNNNESHKEVTFDKDITVFEFEEIKNDKLLLSVVLQIIGMQIFMQVLTGNREKKFMLIVDEAWMILDYAAKFLAEFARTIRKYGGSLVVCVQNFADLNNGDQQKAILQNSTWTILLKQDEKGINSFMESEAFKDMIPLIKSISIAREKYAELLICSTGIKVIGRLALDNYSKTLYSTDAEIFNAINKLTNSGLSLDKAIEEIAKAKYGI